MAREPPAKGQAVRLLVEIVWETLAPLLGWLVSWVCAYVLGWQREFWGR